MTKFSAYLPLLVFTNDMSLMNPSLEPDCDGGGVTPRMNHQGAVEALTCGGLEYSLLAQQLDGWLASTDYLQKYARVHLDLTPPADEVLRNLVTFSFVASHLFSAGGGNTQKKLRRSSISLR